MSALVAATSTASLIAIPREPVESGVSPRTRFPTCVVSLGEVDRRPERLHHHPPGGFC